jgi:hypothetical protein
MASGGRAVHAAKFAAALGVGAAGVLGLCSRASAAEPTQQELIDQIRALQEKVERLEARQQQAAQQQQPQSQAQSQPAHNQPAQSQPASATDEPATVDTVLRDAERRSSPAMLQPEGFTAGYSHGKFLIQDASGNFTLNPNLQFQARYIFNFRDSDAAGAAGGGESVEQDGFEIRRMKIAFDGNIFGRDLTYKFQWNADRNTGSLNLEDAWARLALDRVFGDAASDFAIRAGQFKDPWNHEEITSSKRQLAVERSLLNYAIGGQLTKWVQGVALIWDDGPGGSPLRAEFGYSDGPNTRNTNFTNTGGGLPATFPGEQGPQWGAFGRVEWLVAGDWKQYDDFSALGNTQDLLVFGAGASYAEIGQADVLFHTFDVQYETGPLGIYAAYVGLYNEADGPIPGTDTDPGTAGDQPAIAGHAYDWGFLVQAGYMLNKKWEVFGRYDHLFLDSNRLAPDSEDKFMEMTVGVNYFLNGHAAKFTVDGVWAPNGVPTGDFTGTGLLDPDGDEQQFAVRAQFQLLL